MSVLDFVENYLFKEQNEIQSMHWHTDQVTLFVHITYRRKAEDDTVIKEVHFYVSDDKAHDTVFVQHCFLMHSQWLQKQGLEFKKHWVWSDGCAAPFKAKRPFYFVSRYYAITNMEMTWNFFESGHGKGEHDGAGAVVKRALTHEQLKTDGVDLKCAADIVAFLKDTMSTTTSTGYVKECLVIRHFWNVQIGDVDRSNPWHCAPITGSRSIHSICGYSKVDSTQLKTRMLSCYCDACIHNTTRMCVNKAYVKKWNHITVIPKEHETVENAATIDEPMFEGPDEFIGTYLQVGDNFCCTCRKG